MPDSQPIKFKKRKIKKKQLRGRTTTDETTTNDNSSGVAVKTEGEKVDIAADTAASSLDAIIPPQPPGPANDVGEEEEEPSALSTILTLERRRKILGNRSRGVDAANLGKQSTKTKTATATTTAATAEQTEGEAKNEDLEQRLKGTFAGGKLAGSNDMGGGGDEGGILEKKHMRAMEEFIQQNLTEKRGSDGGDNNGSNDVGVKNNATDAEKELYAELLAPEDAEGGGNAPAGAAVNEGDVGAGGAMMGGTGIAEVALPIDERIKALKETERAAMEYERARKARFGVQMGGDTGDRETLSGVDEVNVAPSRRLEEEANSSQLAAMVPMNFASGPGKRKRQDEGLIQPLDEQKPVKLQTASSQNVGVEYNVESSALPAGSYSASSAGTGVQRSDVSDLGASYSHNFQLHTKEWVMRRRDERQSEIEASQQETEETGPPESKARLGFEMSRKIAKGEAVLPPAGAGGDGGRNEWDKKKGGGNLQSSDERVWRTFMSKQRNRR